MRKIDKKKNFLKVNLLSEQRYLQSKGIVNESFHDVDGKPIGVDINHMPIKENNEMDLEANPRLLDSIMTQISEIVAPYIGIRVADKAISNHNLEVILTVFNQRFSRNSKFKDEHGMEYSKTSGLTEEEEIGDEFFSKYNTTTKEQKEICWNMIQHYGDFDKALKKNIEMRDEAMNKGGEYSDEVKYLNFRVQYMENNRDMLDTQENPFFNK